MFITKTPLRISFFCGGSDMPSFYEQERGAALSVTINKYIYVFSHNVNYTGFRCMYDTIEEHLDLNQMQHSITRETLRHYNFKKEITTASISDIVTKGSGLGSSSAFTVGLIKSLNKEIDAETLAEVACKIEMNKCGYPVGKQDQYAAAFGGFNLFEFEREGGVIVNKIKNKNLSELEGNLMLVYSGRSRDANNILQKQQKAMLDKEKFNTVRRSRDKAYEALQLIEQKRLDDFGELLNKSWSDKKSLCKEITQDYFDEIYERAIKAGSLGGKLLGAGGGGFFIFYVHPENKERVEREITLNTDCKVYDFQFVDHGSQLIFSEN